MPKGPGGSKTAAMLGVSGILFAGLPAYAATPACISVSNVASTAFTLGGVGGSFNSNVATIRIDELLDLTLSPGSGAVSIPTNELAAVPFVLVNTGNGHEAFLLGGRIDGPQAIVEGFAVDRDGDGHFDAATDLAIDPAAATPPLAPGASLRLLALVRGGAAAASATLVVTARAATGSGRPGSDFPGQGDTGCDAVVGASSGLATATVALSVAPGTDTGQITLVKSQRINAPGGGADPVRGATVTYTIESRFDGTGVVRVARVADPIPPGTAYVPGSLRLDGTALTDAADADTGDFDGSAIHVALGDVPAPVTRTIQFQVTIQ